MALELRSKTRVKSKELQVEMLSGLVCAKLGPSSDYAEDLENLAY